TACYVENGRAAFHIKPCDKLFGTRLDRLCDLRKIARRPCCTKLAFQTFNLTCHFCAVHFLTPIFFSYFFLLPVTGVLSVPGDRGRRAPWFIYPANAVASC